MSSPKRMKVRAAPFALLLNPRKTDCGAIDFSSGREVRAATFALLFNPRKTDCGAIDFSSGREVRAATFALLLNPHKTDCGATRFSFLFNFNGRLLRLRAGDAN